jgi:hypothetical protein
MNAIKITASGTGYTREILLTRGYSETDLIRLGIAGSQSDQFVTDIESRSGGNLDDKTTPIKSAKK